MSKTNFDKFIDDILLKEKVKHQKRVEEETAQRKYVKLYKEKPINRIFYNKK